jgi:hypothetical protein
MHARVLLNNNSIVHIVSNINANPQTINKFDNPIGKITLVDDKDVR